MKNERKQRKIEKKKKRREMEEKKIGRKRTIIEKK